jgi:hypothetical protein
MTWRPDSGKSPNRDFVLVNSTLWAHYLDCRKQIDREWRGAGATETILDPAVQATIRASYDELRAQIRQLAPSFSPNETGTYLIPV